MKKRFLTVALAVTTSLCLGLTACGGDGENGDLGEGDKGEHTHNFTWVYNDDANCLEDGTETGTCACGETQTRTKSGTKLGHDMQALPAEEASCAGSGASARSVCSRCGYTADNVTYSDALHVRYELNEAGDGYTVVDVDLSCEHTKIVIPEKYKDLPVTAIGEDAFYACESLEELELPDSIVEIAPYVFPDAIYENPAYRDESGGIYIGKHLIAVWPNTEGAFTVKEGTRSIAGEAFLGAAKITSVTIPEGVSVIAKYTFGDSQTASSVKSVSLPASVTTLSDYAFGPIGFKMLESVTFAKGSRLKEIERYAFRGCINLKGVDLPDGLTTIGDSAFAGCEFPSIVIPGSVTRIGEEAFAENASLKSVVICESTSPEGYISIGNGAFAACFSLDSVTLPDTPISFGVGPFLHTPIYQTESNWDADGTFYIGKHLIDIKPEARGTFTVKPGTISLGCSLFYAADITHIELPDGLAAIGEYAFANCENLTRIDLPESLVVIGRKAFSNCSSLTSIDLPNGLTTIEANAFLDCSSLTGIDLPESLTTIGANAFMGCSSLKSIEIPSHLKKIGEESIRVELEHGYFFMADTYTFGLFSGCDALTSITAEAGNPVYHAAGNCLIETAKKTVVAGCKTSAIPTDGSVAKIGKGAFAEISLNSIVIPESVTEIEDMAFYSTSLKKVSIPKSVTAIGHCAFNGCSSLTSVTFKEGSLLTSIEEGAFSHCNSLKNVVIPESVTFIDIFAFDACGSLEKIEVAAGNQAYCSEGGILYDKEKTKIIAVPMGIKGTVTLPESLTQIGGYDFYNCRFLEKIEIAAGNEFFSSQDGILYNKEKTEIVAVPMGIKGAVTLSESLTQIKSEAFYNCSSLESIVIPESVILIGSNAFKGCSRLQNVKFMQPEGWHCSVSNWTPETNFQSEELQNSATAARFLQDTFCNCTWERN